MHDRVVDTGGVENRTPFLGISMGEHGGKRVTLQRLGANAVVPGERATFDCDIHRSNGFGLLDVRERHCYAVVVDIGVKVLPVGERVVLSLGYAYIDRPLLDPTIKRGGDSKTHVGCVLSTLLGWKR